MLDGRLPSVPTIDKIDRALKSALGRGRRPKVIAGVALAAAVPSQFRTLGQSRVYRELLAAGYGC